MKKIIVAAGVVAMGALFLLYPAEERAERQRESFQKRAPAAETNETASASLKQEQEEPVASVSSLKDSPLAENEKASVESLIRLMAEREALGQSEEDLFTSIGEVGLTPFAARDSNPDTGTLLVVRTNNALPGTRYFHAQVFQNEGEPGHLQHLSFEIRPGKDAMETALSMVQKTHPQLGPPTIRTKDYVLWKTNGRVISVKRLQGEDLQENHFNAHAPEDEGAIWVVSEDDPGHG